METHVSLLNTTVTWGSAIRLNYNLLRKVFVVFTVELNVKTFESRVQFLTLVEPYMRRPANYMHLQ